MELMEDYTAYVTTNAKRADAPGQGQCPRLDAPTTLLDVNLFGVSHDKDA